MIDIILGSVLSISLLVLGAINLNIIISKNNEAKEQKEFIEHLDKLTRNGRIK